MQPLIGIITISFLVANVLGIIIYKGVLSKNGKGVARSDIRNDTITPTPINSISNWKTFTNPYHNYSLKYPDDWHLVQYDQDGKPYDVISSTNLDPDKNVMISPVAIDSGSDIQIEIWVRVWNAKGYESVNDWLNSEYHFDKITPAPHITVNKQTKLVAGHEWEETNWFPGWSGTNRMMLVNGHVYHLQMIPDEYNSLMMDRDITQDAFNYLSTIQQTFQVIEQNNSTL